jgi:hypothetical protein
MMPAVIRQYCITFKSNKMLKSSDKNERHVIFRVPLCRGQVGIPECYQV